MVAEVKTRGCSRRRKREPLRSRAPPWSKAPPWREEPSMSSETAPLLTRAAQAVYWMARYIERAENVARFIDVNLHLQLDLPLEPAHQWQPLIDTSGDADVLDRKSTRLNSSHLGISY